MATRFAVASLAAWRVTHLLAEEDGPGEVVLHLRERAGTSEFGSLMDCFGCLSFWVAAPLSLARHAPPPGRAARLARVVRRCLSPRARHAEAPPAPHHRRTHMNFRRRRP